MLPKTYGHPIDSSKVDNSSSELNNLIVNVEAILTRCDMAK